MKPEKSVDTRIKMLLAQCMFNDCTLLTYCKYSNLTFFFKFFFFFGITSKILHLPFSPPVPTFPPGTHALVRNMNYYTTNLDKVIIFMVDLWLSRNKFVISTLSLIICLDIFFTAHFNLFAYFFFL